MPTFKVICVKTGAEVLNGDGETMVFDSGKSAAAYAKDQTQSTGMKYQPRMISGDDNWRKRETARFFDETYRPLPWDSQYWWRGSMPDLDHFAHVSLENGAMVAFTPDEEHGKADRQVRIKPGPYLERYFGSRILTGAQIRELVSEFSVRYEGLTFKLAKTPFEMKVIYVFGPNSCMSHGLDKYPHTRRRHPVEAYAGPDLAVAYLPATDGNGNEIEGTSTARCVVWPEKKIHNRIYGDSSRLSLMLSEAGYHSGKLDGARLSRIKIGETSDGREQLLAPYIDGHARLLDDGQHLIIDDQNGYLSAQATGGLVQDNRSRCALCRELGNGVREVMDSNFYDIQLICESCLPRDQVCQEDYNGYVVRRDECITIQDERRTRRYHKRWFDNNSGSVIRYSRRESTWVWRDRSVTMVDGDYVSNEWFRSHGRLCERCGIGLERKADGPICYRGDDCWETKRRQRVAEARQSRQAASTTRTVSDADELIEELEA